MTSLNFKLFAPLIGLALNAPRGKNRLIRLCIALASNNKVAASIYGPALQARWHDATFESCVYGYYGSYLSDFLKHYSDPFSFIDIGANIGLFSLIATSNTTCRNCYAFEPNEEVFASLRANVMLNGRRNIACVNAAVTAVNGLVRFSTMRAHSGGGHIDTNGELEVRSVNRQAFDEIAKKDKLPKIIKVDVEGHEPTVLAEVLASELAPSVKNIFFEVNETWYDISLVRQLLSSSGFVQTFQNGEGVHYDLMFERQF